jgi:hypothetical protein
MSCNDFDKEGLELGTTEDLLTILRTKEKD